MIVQRPIASLHHCINFGKKSHFDAEFKLRGGGDGDVELAPLKSECIHESEIDIAQRAILSILSCTYVAGPSSNSTYRNASRRGVMQEGIKKIEKVP